VSADRTFLTAEWQLLAMLNYEVDATLLLPFVPVGTELDQWNSKTFVSLVGFRFLKSRLFGFAPIPMHSSFDEVNLRFYVRREVAGEFRRGVVFLRETVPRWAIAFVARAIYNENYVAAPMKHEIGPSGDAGFKVRYSWQDKQKRWSEIRLETKSSSKLPDKGSVEQFITEHYWGYAAQPREGCVEYRVTHPLWKVWQVCNAAFEGDGQEFHGTAIKDILRSAPASAFLAEGSAVTVMRGRKL
jgi:uncharacterized protein